MNIGGLVLCFVSCRQWTKHCHSVILNKALATCRVIRRYFKPTFMRKYFTKEEVDYIKSNYKEMTAPELAEKLNRGVSSIYTKIYNLGLKKTSFERYSKQEDDFIKKHYANLSDKAIAQQLGRTKQGITARRKLLMLAKTEDMIQRKSTFQKGHIPHNAYPDGTITSRMDSSGIEYLYIKVPGHRKMVMLHIYLWEQQHGKVSSGHIIVFKDGNQANCTIKNLECITRNEHLERNMQSFFAINEAIKDNPELERLYNATKQLKRKIINYKKSKRKSKRKSKHY